jgi:hypothetical protein
MSKTRMDAETENDEQQLAAEQKAIEDARVAAAANPNAPPAPDTPQDMVPPANIDPVAPAAPVAPQPASPAPDKDKEISELKRALDDAKAAQETLRKRLNDEDGQRGTQMKQLQDAIAASKAEIDSLKQQITTAQGGKSGDGKPPAQSGASGSLYDAAIKSGGFSEEFQKSEDMAGFFDVMKHLSVAVEARIANVLSRVEEIGKTTNDVAGATREVKEQVTKSAASTELDRWNAAVERIAPGFAEANGSAAGGKPDEAWMKFLDTAINPALDTKHTFRAMLERDGFQAESVGRVFHMFKQQAAGGQPPAPGATANAQVPSLADQAAPAKAGTANPGANGTKAKPTYTRAQFDQIMQLAGEKTLNREEQAFYNDALLAEVEGRILK